jgi:hypothetical protein
LLGPDYRGCWRTLAHAARIHQEFGVRVEISPFWHGRPGFDLRLAPRRDLTPMLLELLAEIESPEGIRLAARSGLSQLIWIEWDGGRLAPHPRLRRRGRGLAAAAQRRIALQSSGRQLARRLAFPPAAIAALRRLLPDWEVVCLDEQSPLADWCDVLQGCAVFLGVPGGREDLASALDVPVFLIDDSREFREAGAACAWCGTTAEVLFLLRCFLGLRPASLS